MNKYDINNIPISDKTLRVAIYKAFSGKCFYTGRSIPKSQMVVDHIIPKAEGGKDSIYNYVLTFKRLNSQKNAKVDFTEVDKVLYIVKLVYVPKVIKFLKQRKLHILKPKKDNLNKLLWGLYYSIVQSNKGYSYDQMIYYDDIIRNSAFSDVVKDIPRYAECMEAA